MTTATIAAQPHKEIAMHDLIQHSKQFLRDDDGVTAIEYGLIAALIAIVIIAGVKLVGQNLSTVFDKVQSALK